MNEEDWFIGADGLIIGGTGYIEAGGESVIRGGWGR